MRERDIEQHLVARVKALGGEVRKVKWIGRRGAPDRLVLLKAVQWPNPAVVNAMRHFDIEPVPPRGPRQIWIELKAPGVKPEAHQLREHDRMRAFGLDVRVIDSIEGVDEVLR